MAGQRQARPAPEPRAENKVWDDFISCEETYPAHLVRPTSWPPYRSNTFDLHPTMALPCLRCGCVCLAEEGHASGAMRSIEVDLSLIPKRQEPPMTVSEVLS